MPDGIAVIGRLDALAVRSPVERNEPRGALELRDHDEPVAVLDELHGIGTEISGRKTGGQTKGPRLVEKGITGMRLVEQLLATRHERRHFLFRERRCAAARARLHVARLRPESREIGLAVRGARQLPALSLLRLSEGGRRQREPYEAASAGELRNR